MASFARASTSEPASAKPIWAEPAPTFLIASAEPWPRRIFTSRPSAL